MLMIYSILAENAYTIWTNVFFYLFIISSIGTLITVLISSKKITDKSQELKQVQSQYLAKVNTIRKEHGDKFDELRNEMIKKEEERTRQWIESEKETLTVLNGVSHILELSENIGKIESEKVLAKLDEIKDIVERKNTDHEENGKT